MATGIQLITLGIIIVTVFVIMNIYSPYTSASKEPKQEALINYITMDQTPYARLGNIMFSYASLLGIADRNKMIPLFNYQVGIAAGALQNIFQVSLKGLSDTFNADTFVERKFASYDNRTTMLSSMFKGNVSLDRYYQSWKYFSHIEDKVRSHFTLKPRLRTEVIKYLKHIIPKEFNTVGYVRVGIHVRQGDMAMSEKTKQGYNVAPPGYYHKAMKFFKDKFDKVLFVVCSDSILWATEHLKGDNVVYSRSYKQDVDIGILSMMDHSIISVGTYGWWAAWLANGITIYYKYPYNSQGNLLSGFTEEDYYPPHWIAMY